MLIFLPIVWWLDRYDREPVWLVLMSFAWGALFATTGAGLLNSILISHLTSLLGAPLALQLGVILVAPLTEEPLKALILIPIMFSRNFDNATDGFVYGAAIGLGFGMIENFLYFTDTIDDTDVWFMTVVVRTACTAVMHAMATSICGAALGWGKFRTLDIRVISGGLGLFIAIGVHALWNGLAVAAGVTDGTVFLLDILIFLMEFVCILVVFILCVHGEARMIRRELGIEAEGGVLPPQHVEILASVRKRSRTGWLDKSIPQEQYIQTATKLAFRRMQARGRGTNRSYYHEVRKLRYEIRAMFADTSDTTP
jgi:RsiW-degrading membrane proteinase PrsW (M82 family)